MTCVLASSDHPLCAIGAEDARSVATPQIRGNSLVESAERSKLVSRTDGDEHNACQDEQHAQQGSLRQAFAKEEDGVDQCEDEG